MKRRLLACILMLCLIVSIVPAFTLRAEAALYENNNWVVSMAYPNGVAKVTLSKYKGNASNVTVPTKVGGWQIQALNQFAFDGNDNVKTVTVPAGIELGIGVFAGCENLTTVTFKEAVNIPMETFKNCTSLKTVNIPEGYTVIDSEAFQNCGKLQNFTIASSVKEIGASAFDGCSSLKSVTIPSGVTYIEQNTFRGCSGLKSVTIHAGVKGIREGAFSYCDNLEGIWVDSGNPAYYSDAKGVVYYRNEPTLLCAPGALSGAYEIPDYVTKIESYAFAGCTKLEQVSIPENVYFLGTKAFADCTALRQVDLKSEILSDFGSEFLNCSALESITIPTERKLTFYGTFKGCTSLKEVRINAPLYANDSTFEGVTATVYYPGEKAVWETEMQQNYGGNLTWVSFHTHNYQAVVTEPTCIAQGYTTHICSCGDQYVDSYVTAENHSYGAYYTTAEPTCTAVGEERSDCTLCGAYLTRELPIRHDYVDGFCAACGIEEPPFPDVAHADFFYEPVKWAVANGVTTGYTADSFAPDVECTRGQVVTFLWRAAGSPEPELTENPFVDVKETDYFYKAVLWAVENEITNGYGSDTIFNPDGICTRGQVVTFLWRAQNEPAPETTENPFTDVNEIDYFYNPVLWAVENEITNGYGSDTIFNPNGNCTRGQIVTFLYRALAVEA